MFALHQIAKAALPNETGGLLIGYRHEDGTVSVTQVIEVPDASATPLSYVRRHEDAARILEDFLNRQDPDTIEGYVGDWHTHPARAVSSPTDLGTLAQNAALDGHSVALLTLMRGGEDWSPDWHLASSTPGLRTGITISRAGPRG